MMILAVSMHFPWPQDLAMCLHTSVEASDRHQATGTQCTRGGAILKGTHIGGGQLWGVWAGILHSSAVEALQQAQGGGSVGVGVGRMLKGAGRDSGIWHLGMGICAGVENWSDLQEVCSSCAGHCWSTL